MAGKRVKPTLHRGVDEDMQSNPRIRFRRKLSNGLAFISLTQRKSTSARQLPSDAAVTVSTASTDDSFTAVISRDVLLSAQSDAASVTMSKDLPAATLDNAQPAAAAHRYKHLPRSRTCSYIPRLVKVEGEAQSSLGLEKLDETAQNIDMTNSKTTLPTRIPTPSPPQSKRRVSSPRQYLYSKPMLQPKTSVNVQSRLSASQGSWSPVTPRSQTTPNLVKTNGVPHSAKYMAPRRPGAKRHSSLSTPQKVVLSENIPTNKRVPQRRSQMQDKTVKRESLAMPGIANHRRSFGSGVPLTPDGRFVLAPPVSAKRLSTHLTQTSEITSQSPTETPDASNHSGDTTNIQILYKDTESSEATTPSKVNLTKASRAPVLLEEESNAPRRTLGTPNGLSGVWRSSKVFAAANHQVRRLPRSSTFHHFGKRLEGPRPMLVQHRSPSLFDITQSMSQRDTSMSVWNLRRRLRTASQKSESSAKSLLSEIASTQLSREGQSLSSFPPFHLTRAGEVMEKTGRQEGSDKRPHISQIHEDNPDSDRNVSDHAIGFGLPSRSFINLAAIRSSSTKTHQKRTTRSVSGLLPRNATRELQSKRHWSISECFYPNNANNTPGVQVKDYMPELYWAGRFQSRFDRWRTEAMTAMLHPEETHEASGPLSQCSLDDERKATVLIFMQLRDLCTSTQAADSLHVNILSRPHALAPLTSPQEFEYIYRKAHRLLDSSLDLPPSLRKPADHSAKGPIGRAVRRLTPRKTSFANLFRGRGWSRSEDAKVLDVPGHIRELQDIVDETDGSEGESENSTVLLRG